MSLELRQASSAETFVLRQSVLRPHQRVEELASEDDPEAAYFVAIDDGEVISTAVLERSPFPSHLRQGVVGAGIEWRLRGMATDDEWRSQGVGTALLHFVLSAVADAGGGVLWCSARTPARRFYERAGFSAFSAEWVDPLIGPHILMWRRVDGAFSP